VKVILFISADAVAHTLSWTADKDYSIVGLTGQPAAISYNPSLTYAGINNPSPTSTSEAFIIESVWFAKLGNQLDFPLLSGETIYCCTSGTIGLTWLVLKEVVKRSADI
jgi:hypothetical protein